MSASTGGEMLSLVPPNDHKPETCRLCITRLVFVDTVEETSKWLVRVRKQWGSDQPIAIRVTNGTKYLGTTAPKPIVSNAGWTGISWGDNGDCHNDDSAGGCFEISSYQGPMLVLEVVSGANTHSTYGVGMLNGAAVLTERHQYAKYCIHLFPTQTTIDADTVYAVVEAEIHSSSWDGRHRDENLPLEYDFGSVRVSTLDFYFPSFMLTGGGDYIVSSVICAKNMMEEGALAMHLEPLLDARDYISVEPSQVVTVKPQQRVYFAATWNIGERACMKQLQMQLVVNGSQSPSAPILINVHNSPPQLKVIDTPYHYWVNTTCVTNRQFSLSQEFPLVLSLLPVFRLISNGGGVRLGTEGFIIALDKENGENVLVRADGVSVVNTLGMGSSESWMNSSIEALTQDQVNASLWMLHEGGGRLALDRPLLDLSQKTCYCVIHLGIIRGLPMVYEVSTGVSPSFQVSVTLLDQQGWQVVRGDTQPSYQSASGSLRWDDKLVLRKWPGAKSKQFLRLNLTEVCPLDGDETPIGAALLSLYRLDRTRAQMGIQLAFHVYETCSLYDTLHTSSLLMTDTFITFSDLPIAM